MSPVSDGSPLGPEDFTLGYYYGATGAALSYAIPVTLLYITMALVVGRHMRKGREG